MLLPSSDVLLSHPSWFIVPSSVKDGSDTTGGTLQSRITCKKGSHQTDPPEIQSCWRSRFPHGILLSMDLVQIELVTAGLLSGEPFFCDAFSSLPYKDLHSRGAVRLWGAAEILARYPELLRYPSHDDWKKSPGFKNRERKVGKRVNFAHLFRAGPDRMQESVLSDIGEILPLPFFQRIVESRATDLPLLWAWQESLIAEARSTGRVILPFTGISRSFLITASSKYDVNEIVNFPVQTTAATVLRRIQSYIHVRLARAPLRRRTILPFLNIYDAIKFDCRAPSDVSFLTSLIEEAVTFVTTREYWSWLQDLYGRRLLVTYELETSDAS
jgi:DNA polymerase I-like protein with 3'-5' exonuclease and polymerase domains